MVARVFSLSMLRRKISRGKSLGQGMFEFALIMPLLLAMLVGIFEAARAVWIVAAVNTASREASRYGSSSGACDESGDVPCVEGTPRFINCDGIRAVAQQYGWPGGVTTGDVTISYDSGPGTTDIGTCPVLVANLSSCDRIKVQVVGHFDPAAYIPLVNFQEFDITSTNRRTLLNEFLIETANPC